MALRMVKKGNTKLGKDILNFSLPPMITCPGKSKFCDAYCYARRYYKQYPATRSLYDSNLDESKLDSFVETINAELKKANEKGGVFRIHPSGDFYSVEYINKWTEIANHNSNILFYGYTRSYQDPDLLDALTVLENLKNVQLLASTDDTMTCTVPSGWLIAHAGTKPAGKYITCLEQDGKVKTCADCKLCFNKKLTSNIHFKTH